MEPTNPEVKARLVKLVRLLSSDKDGERLGAVYAIERTLKSAGLSWHDLAETIANKIIERTKIVYKDRVITVEVPMRADANSWIKAANMILESRELQDHEKRFVKDMKTRFDLTPDYEPSEKQSNWFVAIYRRTVGGTP